MRNKTKAWRPVVMLLLVGLMLLLAPKLGLTDKLKQLTQWLETLGPLAPLVFVIAYIIATVAALPGFILTLAAGALFGAFWGVICVSLGSTLGAAAAFLIARYLARDGVTAWAEKNEKFKRLHNMVAQQGDVVVALVRLVPIFPFNLVNYGFGLTPVPFWTFLFWSWLCMLPGTILYVVGTSAITQALRQHRIPWALLLITALVFGIVVLLVKHAKRRLHATASRPTTLG